MIDILAIGAHPDDVELGAAGTLLHHQNRGAKIAIVDLTAGELGTRGSAGLRTEEAKLSSSILGLTDRMNLGLKDGFLQSDEASLYKLIAAIRHYRPKVVLANAVEDRHPDHGAGAKFASRACFLAGLRKIETEFDGQKQDAFRPAALYHYIQDRFIHPDLVVDITPWFEKKMEAVMAFGSQFFSPESKEPETPISGENYLRFLEGRAREMGRLIGATYGEGFTAERPPGINNLLDLL
jgi:bacillithiol biosynthesis deacetylase BshB1